MSIYLFLSFTPYVLAGGTVLLAITLGIYTKYPKLLNTYTRIMRHFALTLFLAFTCLWTQQIFDLQSHPLACKFIGNPNMILSSIVWMHEILELYIIDEIKTSIFSFSGFLIPYLFLIVFNFMTAMSFETWNQLR